MIEKPVFAGFFVYSMKINKHMLSVLMQKFFQEEDIQNVLLRFKAKLASFEAKDKFEESRNHLMYLVISAAEKTPEDWDLGCQINIQWIGEHLIDSIQNTGKFSKDKLDDLCSIFFRFLLEFDLSDGRELNMEFRRVKDFVLDNLDCFEHSSREQIEFAVKSMPLEIIKKIVNSEEIKNLKEFNFFAQKSSELKSQWEQEVAEKEERVEQLKSALEQYKNGFNFVGLYQGFDELAEQKEEQLKGVKKGLILMALMSVLPILIQLFVIYNNLDEINQVREALYFSMLPAFSIVIVSIYYFKVILSNYRSLQSQLLQIDLRKTLCRFIQSYSDYSNEIKKSDSDALGKFENIIFSGLVAEDKNIPSTFDGLEQFSKFIKSFK